MRKLFFVLLALFVLISAMSGCREANDVGDETKATTTKATTTTAVNTTAQPQEDPLIDDKPIEMSMMVYQYTDLAQDSPVQLELEKRLEEILGFGIKFKPIPVTWEVSQEKLFTLIAAGDIPDLYLPFQAQQLREEGAALAMEMSFIQKYAPRSVSYINSIDPSAWDYDKLGDKYCGIYQVNPPGEPRVQGWNLYLLKKAGVDEIPETISEMEAALKALRDIDVVGLAAFGKNNSRYFNSIFGAFGNLPYQWDLYDGKVEYGAIQPAMKNALELLNDWYEKGYILQEWAIIGQQDCFQTFFEGTTAYFDDAPWPHFYNPSMYSSPEDPVGEFLVKSQNINPEFDMKLASPPKGTEGHSGNLGWGISRRAHYLGGHLEKDMSKAAKILMIMDELHDNWELRDIARFGFEGVDYELTETGYAKLIGDRSAEYLGKLGTDTTGYFTFMVTNNIEHQNIRLRSQGLREYIEEIYEISPNVYRGVSLPHLGEVQDKYWADLWDFITLNYIEFITGRRDISEFDNFVEEFYSMGGTEMTEAANVAYKK